MNAKIETTPHPLVGKKVRVLAGTVPPIEKLETSDGVITEAAIVHTIHDALLLSFKIEDDKGNLLGHFGRERFVVIV